MIRKPERTCVGCRRVFRKDEVVRIVAGPHGLVLDYREKLAGRAAYVCPERECIKKALTRGGMARSLRVETGTVGPDEFISLLVDTINTKIRSLIAMSAKAGKLAAGYSAVQDALEKHRVGMLVCAHDIAEGTREKILSQAPARIRNATLFSRQELGGMLGREMVAIIALTEQGLAEALWKETERLKNLINAND